MLWFVLLSILVVIMVGLRTRIAFDEFIKYQYSNYHSSWEQDGRPSRIFFRPSKSSLFSGFIFEVKLPYSIPDWARNDEQAISLYKKAFRLEKVTKYCIFILIAFVIISSFFDFS